MAREQSGLSLGQAAERAGLPRAEAEAIESGTVGRMRDRVETLRSLRVYADSLGLPGNDYALAVIDLWPETGTLPGRATDSGQVPTVSVTSAPAGGHAPATGASGGWPSDPAELTDFTVTGVVSPLGSLPAVDGAMSNGSDAESSIFDTGELPAIKNGVSRPLKVLTAFAAVLVALGIFTLVAHSHFSSWSNTISADSSRWWQDLKVATGITTKKPASATAPAPGTLPIVHMVQDPANSHVTVNVHASSFSVKMVAYKQPSWMQVTDASQQAPIYQQVLAGGANTTFPVTRTLTVETGSASARAYIYEGTTFIGFFFPSKAPYTLTFNAVG
jgi:hypothetical protein